MASLTDVICAPPQCRVFATAADILSIAPEMATERVGFPVLSKELAEKKTTETDFGLHKWEEKLSPEAIEEYRAVLQREGFKVGILTNFC